MLESINAGIYISENVPAAQNSVTYTLLKATLKLLNYNIYETVLDSTQSGSIENRKRYWFVAVSKGIDQIDMSLIPNYPRTYSTLGELMEPIANDDPAWRDNQYLKNKSITDAEVGKGFAKRQLVNETTTSIGVINRHYHKRQSTPPMIVNGQGKERLLTPLEHARAKSCRASLVKGVTTTTSHQGLGQGIDMGQLRGIAEMIARSYNQKAA